MTLLEIVQTAAGEMGLPVPTSVIGNTTQQVVQLLSLANGLGRGLMQDFDWQALQTEYRFTTVYYTYSGTGTSGSAVITGIADTSLLSTNFQVSGAGVPQDCYIQSVDSGTQVTLNQALTANGTSYTFAQTKYNLPTDWNRPVNRTQWDKTRHWEMLGPATAEQWQWLKSGFIATGPRIQYRILGDQFQIWPLIAANEYLGFEYMSSYWARSSAGTAKATLTVDTDTCIFRDAIMIAGLKLKYFAIKGFDTQALSAEFNRALSGALGGDKGAQNLRMSGTPTNILINLSNVPDSGYGT